MAPPPYNIWAFVPYYVLILSGSGLPVLAAGEAGDYYRTSRTSCDRRSRVSALRLVWPGSDQVRRRMAHSIVLSVSQTI